MTAPYVNFDLFDWDRLRPILAAAVAALDDDDRAERAKTPGVNFTGMDGDHLCFEWAGKPLCRVHAATLARPGTGWNAAELS